MERGSGVEKPAITHYPLHPRCPNPLKPTCVPRPQAAQVQAALEAELSSARGALDEALAEAADMKGIMADAASMLRQKDAEVRP